MIGRVFKLAAVIGGLAAGSVLAATRGLPVNDGHARTEAAPTRPTRIAGVRVKLILKIVAVLAVLGLLGGMLVATSGIVPIKASSGHWPITARLLEFSMERSVATHSLGIKAPPLDDQSLVLKGAGHYETGCAPCHGSPALSVPRIAWRMTPTPPKLAPTIPEWKPEELFYIVKHGVKFTGMPAWPSAYRDDEVWAMTAFLRQLPGLDAASYRRLANGAGAVNADVVPLANLVAPENTRRALSESCARCHGYDGLGRGVGAFPKLAGQHEVYLLASMQAYTRHHRHSGLMEPVAAGLDDESTRAVSEYYARLPQPAPETHDAAAVARGALIAQQGIPSQGVPACASCHGPKPTARNAIYPLLAGQYAEYLVLQLQLFKHRLRGGTAYAHLMYEVAPGLTEEQMRDVARYYAALSASVPQRTD